MAVDTQRLWRGEAPRWRRQVGDGGGRGRVGRGTLRAVAGSRGALRCRQSRPSTVLLSSQLWVINCAKLVLAIHLAGYSGLTNGQLTQTCLDFDNIGQNWQDSNTILHDQRNGSWSTKGQSWHGAVGLPRHRAPRKGRPARTEGDGGATGLAAVGHKTGSGRKRRRELGATLRRPAVWRPP